ncbi:MAG: hypothetical protein JWO25_2865, partial [Alphaproteobacteria bacterium]|nr:hypothetical protein [Alphaproteobacteria bacterium]
MSTKPSLLTLLAGAAALAAIGHGAAISAAAQAPETRLGASIQQSVADRDRAAARRQRQLDLREQAARATETRLQSAAPAGDPGAQPQQQPGGAAAA